jgi:hypothetical protein
MSLFEERDLTITSVPNDLRVELSGKMVVDIIRLLVMFTIRLSKDSRLYDTVNMMRKALEIILQKRMEGSKQ